MTRKEAIEYWELFNAEIDEMLDLYCSDAVHKKILEEQREATELTIAALREQMEWIRVKDRLPEPGRYVACIAKRNPFSRFMPMVARIEKNGWANPITEQYISEVTHWMPMPNPPKGE